MHRFADDTYLSKNLLVEDIDSAKQDMHICYQFMEPFLPTEAERWEVRSDLAWDAQQLLKLSATDKSLQLSDGQLSAAVTVRNLGVQID